MDIASTEDAIIDDLLVLPDVFDRLTHLVDSTPTAPVPEASSRKEFLVPGCMAQLHIVPTRDDDRWSFTAYSEAPMVMALAGLLCRIFSGQTSTDILSHEPSILERTGIRRQLSPNRQAGASRIVARIKDYVRAASTDDNLQ